jgi:hypothetical protein
MTRSESWHLCLSMGACLLATSAMGQEATSKAAAAAAGKPPQAPFVTSLNGQTGDVTLQGANGIGVITGSRLLTVSSNATATSTGNTIVARDPSGSFSAGSIALAGSLHLPATLSSSVGVLTMGGRPFLHTFGSENTFVGVDAGNLDFVAYPIPGDETEVSVRENTAFGFRALNALTGDATDLVGNKLAASWNSAFGSRALENNTGGLDNSAFGQDALRTNTVGYSNSAFGAMALLTNTTGAFNTAFGLETLEQNTIGMFNTAFGTWSLPSITTDQHNTALGFSAFYSLTSGNWNIALGSGAGSSLTSGSHNIYVGNSGMVSESGTIRIGDSRQTATYVAGIAGQLVSSGDAVYVDSSGKLGTMSSSRRYKQEIVDMSAESDVLMKLHPVSFYYRPDLDTTHLRQYGLVAEEVAEVAPGLVSYDGDGAPQSVRYHLVNAMLLNEVQKQRAVIETQESKIQDLEARLAKLEAASRNR